MRSKPVNISAHATLDAGTRLPTDKLIGLTIVALLPALFWTAMLGLASTAFGFALSTAAMLVTASAIALFLTFIYAAVTTTSNRR